MRHAQQNVAFMQRLSDVHASVHIGVVTPVVGVHGLEDGLRALGARGGVQEDDVPLGEDRELGAHRVHVERLRGRDRDRAHRCASTVACT